MDRNDWVSLGDLVEGENLATELGPISVSSLELYRTTEPVYNFETHGEHVYQVTQLGLLVHNAYHKNADKARGTFAIYEIFINGKLYKVGKAAANALRLNSKGDPTRLATQVRKLQELHKKSDVTGEVVFTMKNTSTRLAKVAERARIDKRVAQNKAAGLKGRMAVPPGNRKSYWP